jgi:predicted MPP superfamily phosphohydrolase
MNVVVWLLAVLGHAFLWIGAVNRLHAIGLRRRLMKRLTLIFFFSAATIPLAVVGMQLANPDRTLMFPWRQTPAWWGVGGVGTVEIPLRLYLALCCVLGLTTPLRLGWMRWRQRRPSLVRFHGRCRPAIDPNSAASDPGECVHHFLTRLPRNEILQLEVTRWSLDVPRLPPALDGLSIVHLSDLHFLGRVGKAYFREVARVANELRGDLVCITGDMMDRTACLDWIPDTLGALRARHGVYFILGNHDRKVETALLRRTLRQNGLVDLGGRCQSVDLGGRTVLLAGNERPWFGEASGSSLNLPAVSDDVPRIVLAHTPDRLPWARKNHADLMLAGHTHGGQIRIPPLGAIFSPSLHGVKHSAGIYHVPPTILHVSRGLSGDIPVRWNCPPEIAFLQLRAGSAGVQTRRRRGTYSSA